MGGREGEWDRARCFSTQTRVREVRVGEEGGGGGQVGGRAGQGLIPQWEVVDTTHLKLWRVGLDTNLLKR